MTQVYTIAMRKITRLTRAPRNGVCIGCTSAYQKGDQVGQFWDHFFCINCLDLDYQPDK